MAFHTGTNDWRLGFQKRYGLPLHVRTHQSSVCIVMFQEWNQVGRDTNHLTWCDVHVFDFFRINDSEVTTNTSDQVRTANDFAAINSDIGWCYKCIRFLIRP